MTLPGLLPASRCRRCGLVAAPPEPFGCEECGALPAEHDRTDLVAFGRVKSFATVWRHAKAEPTTPFTVVHVLLDDGPALKGVIAGDAAAGGLRIGDRVTGALDGELLRWEVG
jgi:uncharacterized protein